MAKHTPHPNRIAALRALADPVRLPLGDDLVRGDSCACDRVRG